MKLYSLPLFRREIVFFELSNLRSTLGIKVFVLWEYRLNGNSSSLPYPVTPTTPHTHTHIYGYSIMYSWHTLWQEHKAQDDVILKSLLYDRCSRGEGGQRWSLVNEVPSTKTIKYITVVCLQFRLPLHDLTCRMKLGWVVISDVSSRCSC